MDGGLLDTEDGVPVLDDCFFEFVDTVVVLYPGGPLLSSIAGGADFPGAADGQSVVGIKEADGDDGESELGGNAGPGIAPVVGP